jgi:ribosomal protein L14E/L6E/L27E
LEAETSVKGTIASDCFYVDDKWIVEPTGETNVTLTVKHQVRFTKRTMLKRVIQNTSNAEAKTWYAGYSKMLLMSLEGKEGSNEVSANDVEKEEAETFDTRQAQQIVVAGPFSNTVLMALLWSCVVAVIAFLLLRLSSMQHTLSLLEDEVSSLREENANAFARLEEVIGELKLANVNE